MKPVHEKINGQKPRDGSLVSTIIRVAKELSENHAQGCQIKPYLDFLNQATANDIKRIELELKAQELELKKKPQDPDESEEVGSDNGRSNGARDEDASRHDVFELLGISGDVSDDQTPESTSGGTIGGASEASQSSG